MQFNMLCGLFLFAITFMMAARPSNADLLDCNEGLKELSEAAAREAQALLRHISVDADANADDVHNNSKDVDIDTSVDVGVMASDEMQQMREFLKKIGCKIKKGATKVSEQAKKFGVELKENAKKLGARAKDLSGVLKTRFNDFKQKFSRELETIEEELREQEDTARGYLANVEIINPDVLKAEQLCGHGHILDALGKCSKLRK